MLKVIETDERKIIPIENLPPGAIGRVDSQRNYDHDALVTRDTAGEYIVLGRTSKGTVRKVEDINGVSVEVVKVGTMIEVDYTGVNL